MARARVVRAATAPAMQSGQITNFSGGPNYRDSPTELAAVEAYGAYNATFDERGGVASRLGFQKRNLSPFGAGYKAQVLGSTPSLYWRLDEGVGALTALDSSGNGVTGTYGSGVTLGQPGLLTGDSDTAASFNDTANALVSSTYAPFVIGSTRTFMGLGNRLSIANTDTLVGGTGSHFPFLSVTNGGEDVWWSPDGSNHVAWVGAWPGLNQGAHWALTYNDTTRVAELFINGVSKGQLTVGVGQGFQDSAVTLILGSAGGVGALNPWNGVLDEFAVFGSVLAAATITSIYNASLGSADFVVNDYYSPLLGVALTQCGKNLYRANGSVSVHAFTTADCVTFTDFGTVVVAAHPVDGMWQSSDGTTWTQITAANAPTTGTRCVAAWQGKLFVGLTDGTVHWSNLGTLATWTNTDFVAIWQKDAQPVVALAVGSGQDIVGRPGLLVFKQDSVYRINNAATGAFTAISTSVGAAGPKAVVGVGGRVCWIGKRGVWWWREGQGAPVNASDTLRPAWRPEQLSFANQNGWAAGRHRNRAYFSCSTVGSNVNDLAFEFHPDEGWICPRSDATTCYSVDATEQTYGGSPTAPGQVYQLNQGGTDDGASITGWFQTRWLVPNGGYQAQVWQARLHGRGAGTVTFRPDYQDSGGSAFPFNFSAALGGFKYDNGVRYDSGARYGTVTLAQSQNVAGLGTCREFSLRFDFTVNSTAIGRSLFGNVPAPLVGAFGLYGVDLLFAPLGLS